MKEESVIGIQNLDPMPIIVGSPRSGTTLLRLMLDSHPDLAIPPETGFLTACEQLSDSGDELRERFFQVVTTHPPEAPGWKDFQIPTEIFHARLQEINPFSIADGFRLFYRMYAERFGKNRWGDKTPLYGQHLEYLQELLPEAHFIHIIRDGRDVAASLRQLWFSPGYDIGIQAHYWRDNVLNTRKQGKRCRHYLEVHYEDLLRQPEHVLRQICAFLEIDFSKEMLFYHDRAPERLEEHLSRHWADGSVLVSHEDRLRQQATTMTPPDLSRIGAWKHSLSDEELCKFEKIVGELLRDLGY